MMFLHFINVQFPFQVSFSAKKLQFCQFFCFKTNKLTVPTLLEHHFWLKVAILC